MEAIIEELPTHCQS